VPQTQLAGGEAEVDFGDAWVELAGELTSAHNRRTTKSLKEIRGGVGSGQGCS